ncbi:MAG: sigma-54-dependent Fis family transcriptional regulator [Nitrospirae bacterium]|nr:sigma-54-dependent Fis family transcriptional regulator [Nitrospirota bacterium]
MNPKILIIDDEESTRFGLSRYLSKVGYIVQDADTLSKSKEAVSSQRFDAIILDLNLPDGNGLDWIPELREIHPDVALVIITGYGDIPVAVEAMRRGADNFLTKPVNMADLDVFLRKSLEIGNLRRKHLTTQRLMRKDQPYFGESSVMKKVMNMISLASENESPVVLLGETGSGKGFLAKWLHDHSPRYSGPFVELNCSNLRGDLLASELFGHAKGSFTSAVHDKQGLIEVADGGTLFLDEISDMDLGVQAQFLKVVEEKQYRRLGEVKMRTSDFRLICATNHDLVEEIKNGRFRKDLYFRINVLPITIPPLRERPEDIPGFVRKILTNLGHNDTEVPDEIIQMLKNYPWPGNIRELRNVLERAILLSQGKTLSTEHFPGLEPCYFISEKNKRLSNLDNIEENHIRAIVKQFNGDTRKASEALGISRATLYRKLKKFQKK